MPRKIICRYEFVQKMLLISFQNFLKLGKDQSEFREYFQEHVIQKLQSLVKKQGQAFSCFRKSILWADNVNRVLTSNKAALVAIFKRFQIKNAFTIESAKTMLKEANIELTRQKRTGHDERVQRLFGLSKQTVANESGQHFYSYLEEIEFFEFFARVADEVHHTSYSRRAGASHYAKQMAIEPLELKILEVLHQRFGKMQQLALQTLLGVVEGGDTLYKDLEKRRTELSKLDDSPRKAAAVEEGKAEDEASSGSLSEIGEGDPAAEDGKGSSKGADSTLAGAKPSRPTIAINLKEIREESPTSTK